MLYDQISSNKRKTYLLIFLFFIVIGTLGYIFGLYFGDAFIGMAFAVVFSVIMILISFYSGDKMILKMSHAVPADRKRYPHLVNTVE